MDFTLVTPNANMTYEVADMVTINWSYEGTVNDVEFLYSTASDDFLSPEIIIDSVANEAPFEFDWAVPNDISHTVRVMVRSLTDDGYDISDVDFRIRGKFFITDPVDSTPVEIGKDYMIYWDSTGDIPNVKLYYDINDGNGGYPYTIPVAGGSIGNCLPTSPVTICFLSFFWEDVPDTLSALARIKIVDSRVNEDDVINESPQFGIIGSLTIVAPNDGEDWRVDSTHNITWTWGGTIPVVKLYYAVDGTQESPDWQEIDPGIVKDYGPGGLFEDGEQVDGDNNNI